MFGLSDKDLNSIKNIISKNPGIKEVIIFGSRAKGNYKRGSDVDIALKGDEVTHSLVNKIKWELNEETNMPYNFDVLDYNEITNEHLLEHINRVGKKVC